MKMYFRLCNPKIYSNYIVLKTFLNSRKPIISFT